LRLMALAQIRCTERELERLIGNMRAFLSYVERLDEVDLSDVPPCHHVLECVVNAMRGDEPHNFLDSKLFLEGSPSHVGGMVRVPPVIKF